LILIDDFLDIVGGLSMDCSPDCSHAGSFNGLYDYALGLYDYFRIPVRVSSGILSYSPGLTRAVLRKATARTSRFR
jgi:hypothetical protein